MVKNVRTENAVRLRISNKFYQPFSIIVRDRARVRPEWKSPNPHIHTLSLGFILGNTHTGQLGVCVNDSRNCIVVHMTGLAGEIFHACDSFVFGLVC